MAGHRRHPGSLTSARLTEMRARCGAATPGPWPAPMLETYVDGGFYAQERANRAFLAAARTDVPALLDEVEATEAETETETPYAQLAAELTHTEAEVERLRALLQRVLDGEHVSAAQHDRMCRYLTGDEDKDTTCDCSHALALEIRAALGTGGAS